MRKDMNASAALYFFAVPNGPGDADPASIHNSGCFQRQIPGDLLRLAHYTQSGEPKLYFTLILRVRINIARGDRMLVQELHL